MAEEGVEEVESFCHSFAVTLCLLGILHAFYPATDFFLQNLDSRFKKNNSGISIH